jgi:hypothetical protein
MIILGTNSIKDTGYNVANSCRFNDDDSAYMHFTPSSAGNRRTMTLSVWFKGTSLADGTNNILGQYNSSNENNSMLLTIESNGRIMVWNYTTSAYTMNLRTNRLLRDPSAWYHVVVAVDTTQSTDTDRVKIYVNGVQETSFFASTYPTQNLELFMNEDKAQNIGTQRFGSTVSSPFDGYMAEFCFIDGQQLAPTSFGEFDDDSPRIWKPKDFKDDVTFGSNGYYLDFEDSSALGNDISGNNNDFTTVNFAATDQATDTCTNNFATLNPLYNAYVDPTFSEGNLKITQSSGWSGAKATMGVSTGKWYWELKLTGTMSSHQHGVQQENVNEGAQNPQNTTGSTSFYNHDGGEMNTDGSNTSADYGTFSSGDIMGLALDMDAGSYGQITIYKNGSAIVSNFNLSSSSTTVMPHLSIDNSTVECNFGSPPYSESGGNSDGNGYGNFSMSVPSGHFCLNTKNLAEYG